MIEFEGKEPTLRLLAEKEEETGREKGLMD